MLKQVPVLGPAGVKFFTARGISQPVVEHFGIFTGRKQGDRVVPALDGDIICFPSYEHGYSVAEKYRPVGEKRYWQRKGGKRVFWNSDAIDDAIRTGQPLIITEGEIDALTAAECGMECVVSVPDGAPAQLSGWDKEPNSERGGKFAFLWRERERLREVKQFILAVDDDEPGQYLAEELVRRLSAYRCAHVEYVPGCKDLNELLLAEGQAAVVRSLSERKPYPTHGLYRLSDYPDVPPLQTFSTGWEPLDHNLRLYLGEIMVVTGVPGHGKSSWVLNLCCNLAEARGWRTALYSPEMPVAPHLRQKLRLLHSRSAEPTAAERSKADDWIEDHFLFLDSDPSRRVENDEDKTLDWIIDKAEEAVNRMGIRMLVIDPWNEVEHARRRDELMHEYIGRAIRMLRKFAQDKQVIVVIVAHPTKDVGKDGMRSPGLYDIDGSAHWANKPDHGVTVFRPEDSPVTSRTQIIVTKARFADAGTTGEVSLVYNRYVERFYELDAAARERIETWKHDKRMAAEAERNERKRAAEERKAKKKPNLTVHDGGKKDE